MVAKKKVIPRAIEALDNNRNPIRTAGWLDSEYTSPVWRVRDSHGGSQVCEIDFRFPMPNGGTLLDYPKLYESVKEFAFLLRDPQYINIQDAEAQAALVRCLMTNAHGLALDGLTSFRHATKDYLDKFTSRIIGAFAGITRASERIQEWLEARHDLSAAELQAQLPTRPQSKRVNILRTTDFLAQLGLPTGVTSVPRAAHLLNVVRTRAGLKGANGATLESAPLAEKFTVQTLFRFFQVFELLFSMRRSMQAESIPEPPFEQTANDLAELHGVPSQRTPLPPPKLALHLISHAMVWVTNYSEQLLQLVKDAKSIPLESRGNRGARVEAFDKLAASYPQEGPAGSPWPLTGNQVRQENGALSMHQTVTMLITACVIVIASFSARRLDELKGLGTADIKGNSRTGWWLRPFIQKTLIYKDWIPTAEIVAKAFDILKTLSADARKTFDNDLIVQWESPFYTDPKAITDALHEQNINMFAAVVDTPAHKGKDGSLTEWHWTTHQFRRFFAVLYFYRYRGARLEDIAHFLRHFDLNMTRKYLEVTPQEKKEFEEVERVYLGDIGREFLEKSGDGIGAGKVLKKMLEDHFDRTVQLSAPSNEEIGDYLYRLKTSRGLQIHPKPWVDCTCPLTKEAANTAACTADRIDTDAVGPDFTVGRPSVCKDCPHQIQNQHFDEYLELENSGVKVVAETELFSGTLLQGLAKARVIEIRQYP